MNLIAVALTLLVQALTSLYFKSPGADQSLLSFNIISREVFGSDEFTLTRNSSEADFRRILTALLYKEEGMPDIEDLPDLAAFCATMKVEADAVPEDTGKAEKLDPPKEE